MSNRKNRSPVPHLNGHAHAGLANDPSVGLAYLKPKAQCPDLPPLGPTYPGEFGKVADKMFERYYAIDAPFEEVLETAIDLHDAALADASAAAAADQEVARAPRGFVEKLEHRARNGQSGQSPASAPEELPILEDDGERRVLKQLARADYALTQYELQGKPGEPAKSRSTVQNKLKSLVEKGLVRRVGKKGRWAATAAGKRVARVS